jgi:adenylate kinase
MERYGVQHLSTGEVIRREICEGSALGKEAAGYIDRGQLAPDALVIDIIADYLCTHDDEDGTIFDGFPRTTAQAGAFDRMLRELGKEVTVMVSLDVPDEVLVSRLLLRGRDSGRKDDSDEAVIRNRIDVYKRETAMVANYYESQGKYCPVNGSGTIDEVFSLLCRQIDDSIAG